MLEYKLSPKAELDIENIFDYSARHFGLQQAEKYYNALVKSFEIFTTNPRIGRNADDIVYGLRRYIHDHHIIYYRIKDNVIMILRVLHHSEDIDQAFE